MRIAAFKPVVTGLSDPPSAGWPHDHELLAATASAGQSATDITTALFGPPLSPHLAAELAGASLDPRALRDSARAARAGADGLICEGVGGLLVPLTPSYLVRDLAADLALPLIVAARPGLGTINHTLLTLEAARTAGLRVAAVVLTPWPGHPAAIERSNRETIEALGRVPVSELPHTEPSSLAAAGAALPLDMWFSSQDD
ncbi:MAG: hypothetical protein NVSMB25_11260 [Thermoleophilaceae bacterium]